MYKKSLFTSFISILMILVFSSGIAFALPSGPDVKAASALLMDLEKGQILYSKDADKKIHIASANKIMTTLVALEKGVLNSEVIISNEAANAGGSVLYLKAGVGYTLEDLLYATILTSANDAPTAIAEYIGSGSIDKFVEYMNAKARELNMKNTYFTNPTGLYDSSQYTTAGDIAIMMGYALSNTTFKEIFSCKGRPWVNQGETSILMNQNKMFWNYNYTDGGKTGYNQSSRQTAITTASRDNRSLLSIVLDSPESAVYEDTIALFNYGFDNFERRILVQANTPLTSIQVEGKELNLVSSRNYYYTSPIGEDYIENIVFNIYEDLELPIKRDQVVGSATYTLNDGLAIEVNLYPETDIVPYISFYQRLKDKLLANKDICTLLIVLIAAEVVLILAKLVKLIHKALKKNTGQSID